MITITKGRLLTIKQWRETYGPGSNVVLPAEEAEELARIALASLEADPVKRVNSDQMRRVCLEANRHLDKYDAMAKEVNKLLGRIAPPAPVVPEEATPENVEMLSGYVSTYKLTDSERDIAAEIWNACRAAMLQSGNFRENKDSSTNNFRKIPEASTSSPVTPDGWISCSDRMPEMGERQYYVLAADFKNNYPPSIPNTQVGVYGDWFNDGNPTWDDGDGEDLHLKEVTHWMPLPEPPKEVRQ
ncbi:TPA: DUF551 domain-containing protein [Escherichia coli]|uniref:DUF551 domain-containing protein n=1 Tax=Escherichia coli TaxID=562 RepID=UPI0006BB2F95|nr:DUF551 domain-containing protein [Escherichia coli]EEZ8069905.1 DUF551 domain-containing protein [Escherichia coli]EFG5824819.1 DUF551 domain-containing protein [Escherichia coli]EFH7401935.1 DUF551 domain-containing protein [Escherichia coli]EFK1980942.1 DUF551 domain-containing protein [Escherichia coli]EFK4487117.1 DUF551 domain-containing protein [Escherichia coli]